MNSFAGNIKTSAQNSLQQAIAENIDVGANQALATTPIYQPVSPLVIFDLGLVSNPIFTENYTCFYEQGILFLCTYLTIFQGEFYEKTNQQECPIEYCPQYKIPVDPTTEMLQMIISEYLTNSASFTFFQTGRV